MLLRVFLSVMITVQDLTFAYLPRRVGETPSAVLDGALLNVSAGGALAVMGASGSGKSTLGYILAGLAPRYTGGNLSGMVLVAQQDVVSVPPKIGTIGLLFQDAATQLFNTSVEDEIVWGLEAMRLPRREISRRLEEVLARFGLEAARHRPPWTLSGGQQKRLALAAVWAMQPQILILDEPLSGLDPQGKAEVLSSIAMLRRTGTTIVVLTLCPRLARETSMVALLSQGKLSSPVSADEILRRNHHLVEAGILYPPEYWPDLNPQVSLWAAAPAVGIKGLHFHYAQGEDVLRGITMTVPAGQFVAVVGPNGSGKSTLLRHLNGLLRPTRGTVHIMGRPAEKRPTGVIAREVGFLFQRPEQQLFASTVREEILFGARQLHLPDLEARLQRTLARFGLERVAEVPPALLGYGMQRAVTLASLAILETPIVVLDEPAVGLDGNGLAQLLDWLAELRRGGRTIILATHEMALASRADRVIALSGGRIIMDGAPEEVLSRSGEG